MAKRGGTTAFKVTATGNVTTRSVILLGVYLVGTGTPGQLVLKDTDTNGNVQLDVETAGANSNIPVAIPNGGIFFPGGIYVDTLSNLGSPTLFYELS